MEGRNRLAAFRNDMRQRSQSFKKILDHGVEDQTSGVRARMISLYRIKFRYSEYNEILKIA
jgi:hypothetical protein